MLGMFCTVPGDLHAWNVGYFSAATIVSVLKRIMPS